MIPALDPRESHHRIPGPLAGRHLFLRCLPPPDGVAGRGIVLYVHGGTFPSALSIAHRLDGRAWRDALCAAGFTVWALDFHGFGCFSDAYADPEPPVPLGRTAEASAQLECAVRFVLEHHHAPNLSLLAHSWGTMVSGHLAARCPALIDRMVFFGPIAPRASAADPPNLPPWRLISLQDQWDRFTADVPAGEAPVLSRRHFDAWGQAYLDCDPASRTRQPPAVRTPSGAFQDIFDAWAGRFPYDPGRVPVPVLVVRGVWDSYCTDDDAAWLLASFPDARDVTVARATHLMHLEENRYALYTAAESFLMEA